jgi:hypothetical protein
MILSVCSKQCLGKRGAILFIATLEIKDIGKDTGLSREMSPWGNHATHAKKEIHKPNYFQTVFKEGHYACLMAKCSAGTNPVSQLQEDLTYRGTMIRLRISVGVFRNVDHLHSKGFPATGILNDSVASKVDLPLGWTGEWGYPKLVELLRQAHLVTGLGSLGTNSVEVKVLDNSYQDSMGHNWPVTRQEFIDYLGAHDSKQGDVQWKDCYSDLKRLPAILQNHRVIFVGAERVRPFARLLGVTDADFVCIPDNDSFALVPQLAERIGSLLYFSTQPVVVMHAAALAGNCLLLELSRRGHAFFGYDLGLAATIFDLEYLSTRPWFRDHGHEIIQTINDFNLQGSHVDASTVVLSRHEIPDVYAAFRDFSEIWIETMQLLRAQPEEAIKTLETYLDNKSYLSFPLANATLLAWKWRFKGDLDETLLDSAVRGTRSEQWLSAAYVYQTSGLHDKAAEQLERVRGQCPYDPRIGIFQQQLIGDTQRESNQWHLAMTFHSRPDFGSRINWSLFGDTVSLKVGSSPKIRNPNKA